jgi:tubulin---tyrosine ligase
MESLPAFYALVDTKDTYINPLILNALESLSTPLLITSLSDLPDPSTKVLQFRDYEDLDFEHVMAHPTTSLCNAYVIRKALIRKHYLSTTISTWISKHPDSLLKDHFKPAVDFELDYAEFLDEALVEAYELHESFGRDEMREKGKRDWWILKPGMSDRGQGIRLFSSEEELREIFEGWEEEEPRSDEDDDEPSGIHKPEREEKGGIITSQLRHFIAQPYIHPPLLLPSSSNRKFHIRTYVLAVGSLQVYVYRDMLALFAAAPYSPPWETETTSGEIDLSAHLTNTCLQDGTREGSVRRFWDLEALPQFPNWKERAYDQIKSVTGKVFEAAARGMMVHFQTLPNVFEVFGLDFLVDGKGKAWLLEVNAFPDFRQTGEGLRGVVGGFFEGVVREGVMPFFDDGQWREERETREEKGLDRVLDIDLGRR